MQTNHKLYFIYETTNLINNKFYVGMHATNDLDDGYLGSGKYLIKSINKYGRENFHRKILLFAINREVLIALEEAIVTADLVRNPMCMNLKPGGHGGFFHLSDEEHRKISKKGYLALKAKLLKDKEFAEKYYSKRKSSSPRGSDHHWHGKYSSNSSNSFYGMKHTEELKRKIGEINSVKQKGELNSQFGTCWVYNLELKENKKIKKEQLEEYLLAGWTKGLVKEFNKKVDPRIKCRQFDL